MTTATLDNPITDEINEMEIPDCEFDMEDFFSEQANVTAAPTIDGDSEIHDEPASAEPPWEDSPVLTPGELAAEQGESPMFSETAGEDWPTEPTPPTPAAERPIWLRICDLEHELGNACREEERLRSLVKSAKELRIELTEQLEELCHERDNPTPAPTEGQRQWTVTVKAGTDQVVGFHASNPSPPQAWGREPIEVLGNHGLKPAKVEALRAAADAGKFGGDVVGLRDWIAKYDLWHRDVKGCGPTGADKIVDALTSYIAQNPVADEPLTAEDEARHVAAAEYLGHTKLKEPVVETSAVEGDFGGHSAPNESADSADDRTAIIGGSSDYAVDVAEPVASNVNPTRKSRVKKMSPPIGLASKSEADGNQVTEDASPAASADETYLAGCYASGLKAGVAGSSCSENPFTDRSSAPAKEWQRGWDVGAEPSI